MSISDMKLDGLTGSYQVTDCDNSRLWVCTNNIPNKKISRLKMVLIFARNAANV
jgi:hypothetical protein